MKSLRSFLGNNISLVVWIHMFKDQWNVCIKVIRKLGATITEMGVDNL
jgi:hypothetical protein